MIVVNGRLVLESMRQWEPSGSGMMVELFGFVASIPQQTYGAGTIVSVAHSVPPASNEIHVQLNAVEWIANPSHVITFGLEESVNGGVDWRPLVSATTRQGDRGRAGDLPAVGVAHPPSLTLIRSFLTLTEPLALGVGWATR